jgi:uncharacterized protein YecE (DUF72 family)
MTSNLDRLSVGTSGWSYPSWRPAFYPEGTANEDFLAFYASRLPSVELNSTGYRLPSEEQFGRWAAAVPAGFRFAVKAPRDDGLLALLLGSTDLRVALDLRDESWDGVDVRPAVRVNDWEADAPFRYLRFREPPHTDDELAAIAARIEPLLTAGVEVFAYFRHEDEPTAPLYAERLLGLVRGDDG